MLNNVEGQAYGTLLGTFMFLGVKFCPSSGVVYFVQRSYCGMALKDLIMSLVLSSVSCGGFGQCHP